MNFYGAKPVAILHEDEYKQWLKDKVIPYYTKYYKPFDEEEGKNYTNSTEKREAFKEYLKNKLAEEKSTEAGNGEKNQEELEEEIQDEIEEILGEKSSPYINLTEEEQQRAKQLLDKVKEDNNWFQEIYEFAIDIPKKVAEAIINFVAALGDSLVNIMQDLMLPTSPTAVAQRRNTLELKELLEERPDEAFLCIFAYKSGDTYKAKPEPINNQPISLIYYSPAAIFSNKIPALDINFIDSSHQVKNPYIIDENGNISQEKIEETKKLLAATENSTQALTQEKEQEINEQIKQMEDNPTAGNSAGILQGIIQKWYVAFRDIAIVLLLIVLVYIGIRILISAAADEKAKYKIMLKDWLIGLVIVVLLHYVMAILLALVRNISNLLATNISITGDNLMNEVRTQISYSTRIDELGRQIGYAVMYFVLIWYTVIFTWQYLKRVIFIAFLTIIAPLVGLTYPIDRIKDGQAQAFNLWIREYIYNLLLQPIHLILYTMLLVSALDLADGGHLIYALVAIGFLMEAEAFIKKLFNFKSKRGGNSGALETGVMFGALASRVKSGSKKITESMQEGIEGPEAGQKTRLQEFSREPNSDAPRNFDSFVNPGAYQQTNNKGRTNYSSGSSGGSNSSINVPKLDTTPSYTKEQLKDKRKEYKNYKKYVAKQQKLRRKENGKLAGRRTPEEIEKLKELGRGVVGERTKRTISGVARASSLLRKRYLNTDTAKKAGKLAVKTLSAGTLGIIGIGAGLASDNMSNVLKLGGAGAAAGMMMGDEASKQAELASEKIGNVKDTFDKGYYGKAYNDLKASQKSDRKWYNSYQTIELYMKKYGSKWKEKREEALQLRKQGITDEKTIERAIKLKDKNDGLTIHQAGNIMKFEGVSRKELLDPKTRQQVKNNVTSLVGGDAALAAVIMNYLDQRHNLQSEDIKEIEQQTQEHQSQEKETQEQESQKTDKKKTDKKKKRKNKNEEEKTKHPLKKVSGVEGTYQEQSQEEEKTKHPLRKVSGVEGTHKEQSQKEEKEKTQENSKSDRGRIRFNKND